MSQLKQFGAGEPEVIDDRTLRFTATSEVEDRDGDIVRVEGIRTANYEKNPTFLWAHQDTHPPLGKVVNLAKLGNEMRIDVKFDGDEFSDMIFEKYKNGSMNAVSIGFEPIEHESLDGGGFDFVETELLEISAVPIPANPDATSHRAKCFGSKDEAIESWAKKVISFKREKQEGTTDFPEEGDDLKVSLRNSQYDRVPLDYAKRIKNEHPDIWDEGGNIQGDDSYQVLKTVIEEHNGAPQTEKQKEIVRKREAWAARHFKDFRLPGVVAQIKWLVVGSRGLDHQKSVIREAIEDKSFELDASTEKGARLGNFMTLLIEAQTDEEEPMRPIVESIADATDRTESAVRSILSGETGCPPVDFFEGAAPVLGVEPEQLIRMAERDGCEYDVEGARNEPEEDEQDGMHGDDEDKSLTKAVTEFQDFPIGDDYDEEWDGDLAEEQAREHASSDGSGDKDTIDWETYREHFLLHDPENPENFGSYKFEYVYHDEDGNMYVPPQGLFAVAGALSGARAEPQPFDEGDIEDAKRHTARYYAKVDEKFPDRDVEVPFDFEGEEDEADKSIDEVKNLEPVNIEFVQDDSAEIEFEIH